MTRRAFGLLVGAALGALLLRVPALRAAKPEDAPQESRDQVAEALRVLEPMMIGASGWRPPRVPRAEEEGTLEHAILAFAPAKFHPVAEGAVPPRRPAARCPGEMSLVGERFCIDRWEASLVERAADGSVRPHPHYESPAPGRAWVAQSKAGVFPQAYVSGPVAAAACQAAGKRLCQPAEWRAACGGHAGTVFPYGARRQPGVCRDSGVAPMLVFHADALKRGWGTAELNDPRLDQLANTVAKSGSHPGCVNDYGAFDMVGNLHEWTADPNGTFQGGYWLDTEQHGDGCAYRTIAHPFEYRDYSIGFRCCAEPEPVTRTP